MSLHDEKPYKPKIRGRRVYGQDELSFWTLRQRVQSAVRNRSDRAARARVATKPLGHLGRRVVVKVWYVRVGSKDAQRSAKMFLRYMEKEGAAPDGGQSILYGVGRSSSTNDPGARRDADQDRATPPNRTAPDDVPGNPTTAFPGHDQIADPKDVDVDEQQAAHSATELERELLEPIPGERHQFRIVVSPDDGDQLDLTRFINELMQQVERDVGQPLIWAAANHYDTDDPHVHVVIRGVDRNGEQVRFDRAYISRIWRERAQEIVTRELGPRTELEYLKQLEREAQQARLTSLDRALSKRAVNGVVLLKELTKPQRERVKVLSEMGLARQLNARAWQLAEGWQQKLRADGERGDIIKRMHSVLRRDTSRYRVVHRFEPLPGASEEGRAITGRVAAIGLVDTTPGGMYAIVESSRGDAYYVPLWKSETTELRQGQVVTLSEQKRSWQKPMDELLEAIAPTDGLVLSTRIAAAIQRRLAAHERTGEAQRGPDGRWTIGRGFREKTPTETHEDRALDRLIFLEAGDAGSVTPTSMVAKVSSRLAELVELGVAESSGDGHRLRPRFRQQLGEYDRTRPRVRVDVRSNRLSLEQCVSYLGPTWLDRVRPHGTQGFAADVATAALRRQAFLRTYGIAEKDLARRERESIAVLHAQRLSRRAAPRANGFVGKLEAVYEAPSGNRYALVVNADFVLAIRAGARARSLIGQEVRLSMGRSEYDGKSKLHMTAVQGHDRGNSGSGPR